MVCPDVDADVVDDDDDDDEDDDDDDADVGVSMIPDKETLVAPPLLPPPTNSYHLWWPYE